MPIVRIFSFIAILVFVGTMSTNPVARAQEQLSEPPPGVAEQWSRGVWVTDIVFWFSNYRKTGASWYVPDSVGANPPSFTPEAAERVREIREGVASGVSLFGPPSLCHPPGLPYILTMPVRFEIQFSPGRIHMLYGADRDYRTIYMDGRGHPEDLELTYYGHSIGWWEDGVLVIDTAGIRGDNTQIEPNIPKSDEMHIVERWKPAGDGKIAVNITMTDPGVLAEPWVVDFHVDNMPNEGVIEEFCTDNNMYRQTEDGGIAMTGPDGKPLEKAED